MGVLSQWRNVPDFFPTPSHLVRRMIELADILPGQSVLEPSAGSGNIAFALHPLCHLKCVERCFSMVEHLRAGGLDVECADFLELPAMPIYDRVLMNPPFSRGIDLKHIDHACQMLKPGGRLVAICSNTTGRKLADRGEWVEYLPEGTFSKSECPTNVNTALTIIDK